VEATCTSTGLTEGKHCSVCGTVLTAQEVVEKIAHIAGEWITDVASDCIQKGIKHTECTVCGTILEIAEIEATGHTEVTDIAVEATCTSTGLTEGKHCSVCGTVLTAQDVVVKLEHTASDWITDVASDCIQKGIKHTECTVCGTILEIAEIEATGHTEVTDNAVEATCTSTGLTEGKHCSVCGAVLTAQEVVNKVAHTISAWVTDVEPDCVQKGSKHTYCTKCNTILEIAEIAATGHTEVTDIAVEATCTSTGLTEGKHCSVCGTVLTAQELVEKIAHTASDWIIDREATVDVEGSRHTECTVCGQTLSEESIEKLKTNVSDVVDGDSADSKGSNSGCFGGIGDNGIVFALSITIIAVLYVVIKRRVVKK
jgi:predicted peroxiredoxin